MSRASELTLFIILVQAAVGFVDATGMFQESYLSVPSNEADYTISDLDTFSSQKGEPSLISDIMLGAEWVIESFFIGLKIVLAVVFVVPALVLTFHIPLILSAFIQVGVYYIYVSFYAQYKSGKPWGAIREV